MNKKIYLVIIIFAIAILAIMITNIQREKIVMVESGDDISRIRINKNTIEDKDTIDDIVEIFKKYDTKKTINPFPMEMSGTEMEIDYSQPNTRCIERVVTRCRTDVEKYKYKKGIYFSGTMDDGLALGVVFLIDENDKVARIIMGWPTAG